MVTIFKSTETGLTPISELADGSWVNLITPGIDDIARLNNEIGIPIDFLTAALDLDERPRTEREGDSILILLRVPFEQGKEADIPFTAIPLGIVLTDRVIVTVCSTDTPIIRNLSRVRDLNTTKRIRFVLRLLEAIAAYFLRCLHAIDGAVEVLEDHLHKSLQNREVLELLKYQKSLTYFTTALKANDLVLGRLQRSRMFNQYPEDEDLLDDVTTEIEQAIEMTRISSDVLSQMMDAFASIISNNLNVVMKLLASFTVILSMPTLIASIYGMNIDLPFQNNSLAFAILMGLALLVSGMITLVFWRKEWL
jgi:magnesium transporter